jgi:hypothetical protein
MSDYDLLGASYTLYRSGYRWDIGSDDPQDAWQDISTAPHETRVLLGWWRDGVWLCETGMASHGWSRNGISNMSLHGQATHWQPLPSPPVQP